MRRSKPRITAAILATLIFAVGCASTAPGSDPLVVRAEQVRDGATDTVAAFLKLEKLETTHPGTAAFLNKPAIHDLAQKLRGVRCGIPADATDARKLEMLAVCPDTAYFTFGHLTEAISAYKTNRTAAGEANVQTWLATVISIVNAVNAYMSGGG